jgi:hypothetical protein
MAEKRAEAPPSPQKKKCRVDAQSPVFKVSNNPKPHTKKEDVASLDDASEGGGGKGISFRPDQPNLHLATKEQLMAALKKLTDEERDAKEEVVGDDEKVVGDDEVSDDGEFELHGRGVSSYARLPSRTRKQTEFFANFGNDEVDDEVEGSSKGGVPKEEGVPRASPSDNEVEGSSEGGVPSMSPSDNEVEGSSEGGVHCR